MITAYIRLQHTPRGRKLRDYQAEEYWGDIDAWRALSTRNGLTLWQIPTQNNIDTSRDKFHRAEYRLQGRDSFNLSSVYWLYPNNKWVETTRGVKYAFGFGYPPDAPTFGGVRAKANPFYMNNRNDAFVFVFSWDGVLEVFVFAGCKTRAMALAEDVRHGKLTTEINGVRDKARRWRTLCPTPADTPKSR